MLKYNIKYRINLIICLFFLTTNIVAQEVEYKTDIKVGAEDFQSYLTLLKNKQVGIVGNQTTAINGVHLVDTLLSLDVNIVKVFAPEHGFRGSADAGEKVKDDKDVKTGLPIISLYGKNKKPKAELISDLDIIIFDIQDVGARFYTYISTMHYVMEAAAENNKKVIVLDRPNPNGFYVDGPILETKYKSFVGMHKVPIVHGMTIGEYAQMLNGEKWLENGIQCDLTVVKCKNYEHKDFYKLPIKPSPNLPNMASIYLYPSLCLFEGTDVSVGRGTPTPFQIFGKPNVDGEFKFTPVPTDGAKRPKHKDMECNGYNLVGFGNQKMREQKSLYLHWLVDMYKRSDNKDTFFVKNGFFNLLCGTREIRNMIEAGKSVEEIQKWYKKDVETFKITRKKYLLYTDFE